MKKTFLLIVLVVLSFRVYSQEVCENPEEDTLDLNSITKCSIKPSKDSNDKKSRQITVKVSASKRFLKKREIIKKQAASSISNVNTAGVSEIATSQPVANDSIKTQPIADSEIITPSPSIAEPANIKNNIESLKEKLSKEEIQKAERFSTVDAIPSFNACNSNDLSELERLDCFNEEMIKHIQKHFRYPSEAVRNQIEGEVWVRFIIDKDGYVSNIKTLGPKNGELLNEEARRVVTKLPRFEPALKNGKSISVKYGFPINFSLEE